LAGQGDMPDTQYIELNIPRQEAFMLKQSTVVLIMATIALPLSGTAWADNPPDAQLGKVHFATSCNEVAQRRFDRAIRYQHSFWYRESKEIFRSVLEADPTCAIATWGIAQSLLANPFNPTPPKNLTEGFAAIQMGMRIGAATQRENDLIAAIGVYYTDFVKLDQRSRAQAYLKAMAEVAGRYPDDDETQIYYALTLDVAASPSDKTYANQLKAAAILEGIFKRQPQHPGVAHYLIHTYDYPPIAEKGVDAAQRYAKIAEAAPHAQHMPSHIFTRVGYWKESIASNTVAANLAKAEKEPDDQLHASDYMVYASLQLGRDGAARQIIGEMNTVTGFNPDRNTGLFALAASPARYVVERGDWKGATELQVRPSKFGYVDAITHFARALGAARSGNPDAATADIAKLAELRDRLREAKDAYWSVQVDIQWQVASAWVSHAQGRHEEALKIMSAAADAEDKTEKGTVTPGPLAPARELYGAMLLDRGKAADALAAFEAVLKKEPNRFNALSGAARAAEKVGDREKAAGYYKKVTVLARDSDSTRPDLALAKQFLAKR
jgi:tetratricopeptide (TPR) repeat protein